jgi:hypothetical protein
MSRETQQTTKRTRSTLPPPLTLEVQIQRAQQTAWMYAWDHDRQRLRVTGVQQAHTDLPADLASLRIESQKEVPVLVFAPPQGLAPGTWVSVRILGALQRLPAKPADSHAFPLDGWLLLAVPDLPQCLLAFTSLEELPAEFLAACHTYWRYQAMLSSVSVAQIVSHPATTVEQRLREARGWLKRAQHEQAQHRRVSVAQTEEKAVAWRSIEGLTAEQRRQMGQAKTLEELTPFLQAEQLIQFVPPRYQQALSHLLLDDERLLAFLHRPLLQRRTGILGLQQWRSNEGLFLVTDRQLLWLRDFFSPGSSGMTTGYFAHTAPLERLSSIQVLPLGPTPAPWADALRTRSLPYVRLALEIASLTGSEWFVVEFPPGATTEEALARVATVLHAFLPLAPGQQERRVCRLPQIEAWMPRGAEAERLAALGGIFPEEGKHRLEQRLAERLATTGEDLLVSVLVPALVEYQSPPRLVALTRQAVLLFDEAVEKRLFLSKRPASGQIVEHRYELPHISSAQLNYSLFGSSLRLFVPHQRNGVQHLDIPFHSPAIAWFLPLFTRLRLLLTSPVHQTQPECASGEAKGVSYVNA